MTKTTAFTLSVTLALTTSSVVANTATGNTYYVAKTGTDSNSCTQARSQSAPKLTINAGIACLASGDTLTIKAGIYNENVITHSIQSIASGTPGAYTTIKAETRGTVIMTAPSSAYCAFDINHDESYIMIDGIVLDGSNNNANSGFCANWGDGTVSHHIRLQYVESKNFRQQGMATGGGDVLEVLYSSSHHNGKDCTGWALGPGHCHGIYLGTPNAVIEDSEFYNNEGFGIHLYSEPARNNNVIVRDNLIHDNGIGGAAGFKPTYGMILGSGNNIQAYNNTIWNNSGGGILIEYNATNVSAYNNTIYGNGASYPGGCFLIAQASGTIVRNNICWQNPGGIIDSSSPPAVISSNLMTNPLFVDAANDNFSLQSGSPAIAMNAGASLTSP